MPILSASWSLLLILYFVKLSDGFCPIACECNEVALSGEHEPVFILSCRFNGKSFPIEALSP